MTKDKILALKYRPQEFKDLIGQDVMTQTITNAIKLNKTPNAYLLTGIRGVGKTTTARLISKALNCQKNDDKNIQCSNGKFCPTCEEIINSNHMDILEMDAASKTGIDDIRDLIENSKYSPTSAKYKIFIIDEVHMLSKQAFNGMLKTLEEPPPKLKFILATTEVRKIPVTILSRCQRFDLKRVSIESLCNHLKAISLKEKGKITDDAIKLIAKTSEGSVRDAISLLDRALVSQIIGDQSEVNEENIRQMLGLADKSKILKMFKEILNGDEGEALKYLRQFIDNGVDAKNLLNDFLEILYLFSRRINLGPINQDITVSEEENKLIEEYSKNIDMNDIGLFWQLTIKTIDDLKIIGDENLTLEMFIMQITHLKGIEANDKTIYKDKNENNIQLKKEKLMGEKLQNENLEDNLPNQIKNQLKNTDQIKINPTKNSNPEMKTEKIKIKSFDELVNVATRNKEIELKFDLERNVKLVSFNKGKINICFNDKLNKNFIKNLTEKLLVWTGERWIISLSKNIDAKSIYEKNLESKNIELSKFKQSELAKKISDVFPDSKLIDIKEENND